MKFLLYYKIEKECEWIENNWFLEVQGDKPTYEELQSFFRIARSRHDTFNRPIIINIFELE